MRRPQLRVSASGKDSDNEKTGLLGRWERLSKEALPKEASEGEPEGGEKEPGYGLLDLAAYNKGWQVPWGGGDLALGMTLWLVSFVAVGLLVVPWVGRLLGFELGVGKLNQMDQAELTLINQVGSKATVASCPVHIV